MLLSLVTKIRSRGFFMYLFEHYFFSLIAPDAMINRALFFYKVLLEKKLQITVILLWERENGLLIFTRARVKFSCNIILIGCLNISWIELFTQIFFGINIMLQALRKWYFKFLTKRNIQMNIHIRLWSMSRNQTWIIA